MKIRSIIIVVAAILCVDSCCAWKTFWKGRSNNGNLHQLLENYQDKGALPAEEWFENILDHNDLTNNATWKQLYYTRKDLYKAGGPVFLMVGGEGPISAKFMNEGAWIQYAKEHNALCFQLEHRFYGKSHPTEDLSTKNIQYLSSQQALADLSYFIVSMNQQYNLVPDTKWVAFGGSYPGSLAAWVREKFPHLIHAAVSSSGPLLAKVDFNEYFEVVERSLATYSADCVKAVKSSVDQVETLLKHMIGQRTLNDKFKLCDPIEKSVENPLDVANFFETLADNFAGVVQYNKDNSPHATVNIDDVCAIMVNQTMGPPVTRLAKVNEMIMEKEKTKCLEYKYDNMINEMRNVSLHSSVSNGTRQWTYQTCTEFGFYQTSETTNSLFGNRFPVNFFVKQCSDIFGDQFDDEFLNKSVMKTNTDYGQLRPGTTNVIFIHGSIDPWHALGLTKSSDPDLPTIYIEGTAHCANMYEPKDSDLPQLKEARTQIRKFLQKVLK